ncbi:unnamed protein product, partial [Ectocarpus fasciculatus]
KQDRSHGYGREDLEVSVERGTCGQWACRLGCLSFAGGRPLSANSASVE